MSATIQHLVAVRSSLAETIEKYYLALSEKAEHTPWGTQVRASVIAIPARVLKKDTRPERERRPKRERDEDDREDSRDWRPQMDPSIAALYEQPIGEKEEAPWEQERLNLQRAVILGAPGGGKTFLTQTTALALAKQGLEEREKRSKPLDQLPLPIRVDLNDLASESGSDDLLDILPPLVSRDYKLPALEPWLRRNLKAENCWLILDALDQVGSDHMVGLTRRLASILDWKCHALVTCRKANYDRTNLPWKTVTEYELAPFDATEMAAFITRWHAGKDARGEKLNEVVGRSYSLQQACGTPLMLTLACLANEEEALTEETRRVDLYWTVLRGIMRNAWREPRLGPKDPRIDDLLRMLRPMAWNLFVASPSVNQFASSRVVEAIEVGANAARLPDPVLGLRGELVERGVLVDVGVMRGEGQFSFLHRSFQEFLVAEYLGREVDARGWEAIRPLLDKKSWAPEWQEVIVLLAGILRDPAALLKMLSIPEKDDLFRHRLALAAQCMGELSAEVECRELINNVTAQTWECYWGHAIQSTEKAVQGIVDALPALAKVDGEISSHLRLLAHVTGLLRNPDEHVRSDAAGALGRMGPTAAHTEVVDRLVACLRDPVRDVRYGATDALGAMAPTAARANVVDRLLELLRHSEGILGYHAAVALGRMGPAVHAVVVDRVFEYLLDQDANVRASAALALGRMGPAAVRAGVVDRLVECLRDPDRRLRSGAATALRRIGPTAARADVVDRLVECLRDPDDLVRIDAAEALGRMGSAAARSDVVDRLVEGLRDPDERVQYQAAKTLEYLGPTVARADVVKHLLECLRHPRGNVGYVAAVALATMGPTAARGDVVDGLVDCLGVRATRSINAAGALVLKGPEVGRSDVMSNAAVALGRMGLAAARPDAVDRLVGVLGSGWIDVEPIAAEALGRIGPAAARADVVDWLMVHLGHWNPTERSRAAEALGRLMGTGARFFRAEQGLTVESVKDLSRYENAV